MIKVEILTAPGCVHCEEAKKIIYKVKNEFPNIKVEIIDVTENYEVAQKYMLMTAPGIAINGKLEFIGVPEEDRLRRILRELSRRE